jgi:hypothetical protein
MKHAIHPYDEVYYSDAGSLLTQRMTLHNSGGQWVKSAGAIQ